MNENDSLITKILPQRYPFLYIDRILTFEKDKKLIALKNVSANEEYFKGHFPQAAIMPGVLLIESMGQAAILFLAMNANSISDNDASNKGIYYLCSVKARFLCPVKPGDRVIIEVTPIKITANSGILRTTAKVDDKKVAYAELVGSKQGKNE